MGPLRVVPSLLVAVWAVAGVAEAQGPAPGLRGYATLSSSYWRYGLSQSDGPTLALAIDYEHPTGFFTYGRAVNVDYGPYSYSRDLEVSAYVGYHDRRPGWSWTTSIGRYAYPGTSGYYDYDEWVLGVGVRDRVFYSIAHIDDYYGSRSSGVAQEVSVAFPLRGDFEVGGAVGSFDLADGGPDFTHWNVGVSKLIGRFALDLRRYDSGYERRGWLGDPYGQRYVVSVSYAMRGKPTGR